MRALTWVLGLLAVVACSADGDCSESCDEAADDCTANDPDGMPSDDGSFCNGTETFAAGVCNVSNGDPCPGADGDDDCAESCDEAADDCTANDPDGTSCSNDGGTCSGGICPDDGDGDGADDDEDDGGVCSCRLPRRTPARSPALLLALFGFGLMLQRRRR